MSRQRHGHEYTALVVTSLTMGRGVLDGVSPATQSPLVVDPFDRSLENANLVVVAPSGGGKSYFVKLLALRNLVQGVDFLVIDPEDEYGALCAAAGGQYIRLASSSPHRLNPFDLPPRGVHDDAEGQDPLAERVTALHSLLAVMLTTGGSPPDARERAALDRALYQAYAGVGITANPASHGRPSPSLRDLHAVLVGMPGDVAISLAARPEPFVHGSLAAGLFGGPTNVQLDGRLVAFTIQQLADEPWPLAIQLIAGHVRRHGPAARGPALGLSADVSCGRARRWRRRPPGRAPGQRVRQVPAHRCQDDVLGPAVAAEGRGRVLGERAPAPRAGVLLATATIAPIVLGGLLAGGAGRACVAHSPSTPRVPELLR